MYLLISHRQAIGELIDIGCINIRDAGSVNCELALRRCRNINELIPRNIEVTSCLSPPDYLRQTDETVSRRCTEKVRIIALCIIFLDTKILRMLLRIRKQLPRS